MMNMDIYQDHPSTSKNSKQDKYIKIIGIVVFSAGILGLILFCILSVYSISLTRKQLEEYVAASTATADFYETLLFSARKWPIKMSDEFIDYRYGWDYLKEWDKDDYNKVRAFIKDEAYYTEVIANQGFVWRLSPDYFEDSITDFFLSVEVQIIAGPSDAEIGIFFRKVGTRYYIFYLGNRGYYGVALHNYGGWTPLDRGYYSVSTPDQDWQKSDIILTPTPYEDYGHEEKVRLSLVAQGSHFYFYVNDDFLTEVENDVSSRGQMGLMISMNDIGDKGEFLFDNLEIRTPE
jgi:hypothetical protein